MSELIINKDNKGNIKNAELRDVMFFYTKIGPNKSVIYDQHTLPKHKQTLFEQSVDILITEDVADELEELLPKASIKKMPRAKFLEKYKVEDGSTIPNEKRLYVYKSVQKMQNRDGDDVNPALLPRAFEVVNGKAVEITHTKNIGNGSKGDIRLRISVNPSYGTFGYPALIKVVDLVEYESGGGSADMSDFLGDDIEIESEEVKKASVAQAQESSEDSDEGFDDVPFDTDDDEEDY